MILNILRAMLIFLCANAIAAQASATNLPPVKTLSVEDGLSQASVSDIIQDKQGFVWIATQAGVDRFDGYDFVNSIEFNDDGPGRQFVLDLEEDPSTSDIYMVSRSILQKYNQNTAQTEVLDLPKSDTQLSLNYYHIDQDKHHILATNKGIFLRENIQQEYALISQADTNFYVKDVVLRNDILWFATTRGLFTYNVKSKEWLFAGLAKYSINAIEFINEHEAWLGTNGEGIVIVDTQSPSLNIKSSLTLAQGLIDNNVTDLTPISSGELWVSTSAGLSIIDKVTGEISNHALPSTDSDLSHSLTTLYETNNGLVFYGTFASGIGILDRRANIIEQYKIPSVARTFIAEAGAQNEYWATTDQGLWTFDIDRNTNGPFGYGPNAPYQTQNNILIPEYDSINNTIWLGTRAGLAKFDPEKEQLEHVGFDGIQTFPIKNGEQGRLWIGTQSDGLYHFNTLSRQIIKHYDIGNVSNLFYESKNRLWVSTLNGLFLIDPETDEQTMFKHDANNPASLHTNDITSVSKDSKGNYLVGTQSKGLSLMQFEPTENKVNFTPLFNDTILGSLSIGAVAEDESGYYWLTTTKNIARISPDFSNIQFFDSKDGANASGYFVAGYTKDSNGTIYFSGPEGISVIDPVVFKTSSEMPTLQFTDLKVVQKNINDLTSSYALGSAISADNTKQLELTPNDLMFTVSFAAIEFGNPESIQYQYRLVGFQNRWQKSERGVRKATFSNLDPGVYILQIQSTNRYGDWNPEYAEISIKVAAPWYQTTLAKFVFLILVSILIYALFVWRTYSLKKQSEVLSEKVVQKTEELQLANTKLQQLSTVDPLTTIFNRRGFNQAVNKITKKSLSKNSCFGVLLLDLDNFKEVNDKYGHNAGDKTLTNIATFLKESLPTGSVLGRWGGDEFIMVLQADYMIDISKEAIKLKQALEKMPIPINTGEVSVTVTIGVTQLTDSSELESAIGAADKLLYEGKKAGRNKVVCAGAVF